MSDSCSDCTPNPDGSPKWVNNVASLFPFRIEGEEIVFRYRCGTCRREWGERKNFNEMMDGMERNPLEAPRMTLSPSAASFRTMEESLFRAIATGPYNLIVSPEALAAFRARAIALGIEISK